MNTTDTIIDLLRHGEPVGGPRYRGHVDDPLSDKGWAQMRAAVAGRDEEWDVVVSSDLTRCADFARELATRHDLPHLLDSAFREVSFGMWEGRTAAELLAADPGGVAAFWRDPVRNTPLGAEPLTHFRDRVIDAWERLLQAQRGQRVLLVCHAGVMRILLLHALDLRLDAFYRFEPGNASLVRLKVTDGRHGEAWHQLVFPAPQV
jgi:alpha-ribazole phosphatase